jgi:aminoglycoside phosphotransferase (APT) family kinase protein
MKECIRAPQSEPNALRLVEKYTTIPAPRIVDVGEYNGKTYLIMTRLPGQQLNHVIHLMSYSERQRLADDLANCVSQLRKIPNHTPYLFTNTVGGPVVDHRIPDGQAGPFNSEADFNNHLTSHLGCTPDKVLDGLTMRQDHRSYFTHSHFFSFNLLVEAGRLSGIVDWECAGYMPEYWEFIKAKRAAHRKPILDAIFDRTFGSAYEKEWEIERKLWRLTPFGV